MCGEEEVLAKLLLLQKKIDESKEQIDACKEHTFYLAYKLADTEQVTAIQIVTKPQFQNFIKSMEGLETLLDSLKLLFNLENASKRLNINDVSAALEYYKTTIDKKE